MKNGRNNYNSDYCDSIVIDSAIRLYPIYPALVVDNGDDAYGVIDGKQRLTIFTSYCICQFMTIYGII